MKPLKSERALVFCKAPVPGKVKTRLAGHLGQVAAAQLHADMATRLLSQLSPQTAEIWCAPDGSHEFFNTWRQNGFATHNQEGADLGERMHHALTTALGRPDTTAAVLVGTDCPDIDAAYIAAAHQALKHCDAVLAPAEDGGYGLIGMRRPLPIFTGIAWSTDQVLAQTCQLLEAQRLSYQLLPTVWDIDRPEDYQRYVRWQAGH